MQAHEAKLLELMEKSRQFMIPIYQRTYSWKERECRQLWEDIENAGKNASISSHFTGAIVYIDQGVHVTKYKPLLVIDGQQRLTTFSLILEALARKVGTSELVDGFSSKKIRNRYLLDPDEEGDRHFKLLLNQTDKLSLFALVQDKPPPLEYSVRIAENFEYFNKRMQDLDLDDVARFCNGLLKITVIDVSLSRDQDNPQLIFESMNSTGRELTQADLIRNFVLIELEPVLQQKIYEEHWRPMELAFGQEAYANDFDQFMRHYLTLKLGDIPVIKAIYEEFKYYARSSESDLGGREQLVGDIRLYADYYCAMALGKEKDGDLAEVFGDICELKVDVAYPLLLELYADFDQGLISKDDLMCAVRLIESYVFRRAICSIPTNSLNKTFATFTRALRKERYVESIKAHFLTLPSYRRFPNDDEFKRELITRDLYNFARRSYYLRRLENYNRKEFAQIQEYTVEHIMPQNPDLPLPWQEALGSEWQQVQQKWLHTLGNLTLTGYNSEYSDKPFSEKRDMPRGFKDSPLKLNQELRNAETWNENEIRQRADQLATEAMKIWMAPSLPEEILAKYQNGSRPSSDYTLADSQHPMVGNSMFPLFERFRKEVLALDPGITEEILEHSIGFNAESNFAEIVPQENQLLLSLHLRIHEVDDPKKIVKDVASLRHRQGNGNIEVAIRADEELPYILGLVRQAYEQQI